jgi:phage shock protein PspC (stress-responsive transcriptional regulator)
MADTKRLTRSRTERWIGGVCGGIGNYFNVDATVIRVVFVLAALIMGGGLLIYLILWLIIPLEAEETLAVEEPPAEEGE